MKLKKIFISEHKIMLISSIIMNFPFKKKN